MDVWPQYAILAIITISLIINLVGDQRKEKTSDRVIGVLASFFMFAMYAGLLAAGGFWRPLFQ